MHSAKNTKNNNAKPFPSFFPQFFHSLVYNLLCYKAMLHLNGLTIGFGDAPVQFLGVLLS